MLQQRKRGAKRGTSSDCDISGERTTPMFQSSSSLVEMREGLSLQLFIEGQKPLKRILVVKWIMSGQVGCQIRWWLNSRMLLPKDQMGSL